jgi:hypothetical protein
MQHSAIVGASPIILRVLPPSQLFAIVSCMKATNLEAALNKRPFRSFEIRVDGEVLTVRHPEQVLFAEGKTTVIVVDPDDHVHILDAEQISKVRLLPRRGS